MAFSRHATTYLIIRDGNHEKVLDQVGHDEVALGLKTFRQESGELNQHCRVGGEEFR